MHILYLFTMTGFRLKKGTLEKQLAQAEEKINKSEEIVPICANCNKIRDDEKYWNQLELVRQSFISSDQELTYSNKYCIECSETMKN